MNFMFKGHTIFSINSGFGNNRQALNKYDISSIEQLGEVISTSKNTEAINFMDRQLYDFEELRKSNKDVPSTRKASQIDIAKVNGNPRAFVKV